MVGHMRQMEREKKEVNRKVGGVTRFHKETLTWKMFLKEKSTARTLDQLLWTFTLI